MDTSRGSVVGDIPIGRWRRWWQERECRCHPGAWWHRWFGRDIDHHIVRGGGDSHRRCGGNRKCEWFLHVDRMGRDDIDRDRRSIRGRSCGRWSQWNLEFDHRRRCDLWVIGRKGAELRRWIGCGQRCEQLDEQLHWWWLGCCEPWWWRRWWRSLHDRFRYGCQLQLRNRRKRRERIRGNSLGGVRGRIVHVDDVAHQHHWISLVHAHLHKRCRYRDAHGV